MARPLRIEYPGAWYHVTSRGGERAEIFRDDRDRKRFLEALQESVEIFKVEVHCYVLMSNHFHFLLRTPEANLCRFMHRFNTAYTGYFTLRHHRPGHLYQGRYKAILVDADDYLLELSRYVHLNPVRIKKYEGLPLPEKRRMLEGYQWSSFPSYIGLKRREVFVTYGDVLRFMGGDTREARERYKDFVIQGLARGCDKVLEEAKAGAILGGDRFVDWVRKTFIGIKELAHRDFPDARALDRVVPVKEIALAVSRDYGVTSEEVESSWSKWREARQVLMELSYRLNYRKKSLRELGHELGGIGGDSIAHSRAKLRIRLRKDKSLLKRIERLERNLRNQ
jgi:putative transposase